MWETDEYRKKIFDKISTLIMDLKIKGFDNGIEVEGYADGGVIGPNPKSYSSNLDLSSARSNNVIKYFWASGLDPNRLADGNLKAKFKGVAYGEFEPDEDNLTPEQRAYNRKVNILIRKDN